MKLVGRVITRETQESKATEASMIVNPVNGSIRFNPVATIKLDMEGKTIAFGYPEEGDDEQKVYMYFPEEDGFKVGKGQVSSRYHSRELAKAFDTDLTEKFKLIVSVKPIVMENFPGMNFYEVTFDNSSAIKKTETAEVTKTVEVEEGQEAQVQL